MRFCLQRTKAQEVDVSRLKITRVRQTDERPQKWHAHGDLMNFGMSELLSLALYRYI